VISSFRREVDENFTLLGYYAASSGNSLPTGLQNDISHAELERHFSKVCHHSLLSSLRDASEQTASFAVYFCAVFNDAVRSPAYIGNLFENKQQPYLLLKLISHFLNTCMWIGGDLHFLSQEAATCYIEQLLILFIQQSAEGILKE
jgi:hypothetical protein